MKDDRCARKTSTDYAAVLVEYKNLHLCYDVMDGYQDVDGMRSLLQWSNLYFKRSFSDVLNNKYFSEDESVKIHPLGMNYQVSCKGNPYNFLGGGGEIPYSDSVEINQSHTLRRTDLKQE